MKNFLAIFLAIAVAVTGYQCTGGEGGGSSSSAAKGLTISGTVKNAANMQANLNKISIASTRPDHIVANTTTDAEGNFSFDFPDGQEAGIYNVRFGVQKVFLVLDGTESDVKITGDLNTINRFSYQVEGSPTSTEFLGTLQGLVARTMQADGVKTFVETTPNALAAAAVASMALPNKQFIATHEVAKKRLAEQMPNSDYVGDYNKFIASLNKVSSNSKSYQFVEKENRQDAPNIDLPNPNGKNYSLDALKGKVVLLDFWASWCGPCRRENPHVVDIYKKYKEKGFTVFSVSLDGLDTRSKARYSGDEAAIAKAMEAQKKRWVDAIAKDKLEWDYHVSNLQKWECPQAKQYQVSSIPRTFMIDRDGKIAAMNLRGAAQIEERLLKLL